MSTDADDRCHVLIVGAGPSGAIAARELALAGFDVVCLEQGSWKTAGDFMSTSLERELHMLKDWSWNPNVRSWDEDYPCEVSDADVYPLMFNAVGGSTIHFGAEWPRFAPSDFRVRSQDGVADDWPISYEELAPYYERADALIGVSGLVGDPAYPAGAAPPMPAVPIGKMGRKAAEGMNKLGWHWWPMTHAIATQPYGRLAACARRAVCGQGCPEGAKGSADLSVWPDAIAAGARLVTGARAREVYTDDRGAAAGVEWVDRDGATHRTAADVVVMAANGVGTSRLLLLSASDRYPDGLANSSGLVGRRLMMHPGASVLGVYEEGLDSWLGPLGSQITSMQFRETDWSRGFPRGSKWVMMPVPGPIELLWRYADLPIRERIGENLQKIVRSGLGRTIEIGFSIDDLPDEENRVTLDPTLTDSDGIPAPKITYRCSEYSQLALEWNRERAAEVHQAAGALEIRAPKSNPDTGWHLIGTARMGDDPGSSVVDPFCRSHDVENLFIVDGSVFVTGSAANPTATICALALRASETIRETAASRRGALT